MRLFSWLTSALAFALVIGAAQADPASDLKSGPQVGKSPGPFSPLHCNGSDEGNKRCLVCSNGSNPVAMVFARNVDGNLTKLIKKIDEATQKNSSASMGSFVVFLNDEEGMDKKLKDLAKSEGIKETILSIESPAGPKGYNIPKDAEITVVLYTNRSVKANMAFKKGEFTEADVQKVVDGIKNIVPAN